MGDRTGDLSFTTGRILVQQAMRTINMHAVSTVGRALCLLACTKVAWQYDLLAWPSGPTHTYCGTDHVEPNHRLPGLRSS